MKILFRTSGGLAPKKELGLGHIYRSANLAHFLKPNKIDFLLEDYGGAKKILKKKGYKKITLLKKNITLKEDIRDTIEYVKNNKIDIMIIDRYPLNPEYVKHVGRFTKVAVISDLRNFNYKCDLIINGFIGFKNKVIKNKFGTKCLLGPAYQILDKRFMKSKRKKKKYVLLATFGGFDENNIVEILIEVLSQHSEMIKTRIILGPLTKKSSRIKEAEKKFPNNLEIISQSVSMHKEISQSEFGICSGGITTYEFAVYNVPFAIISQVKHQLITAREWQYRNMAINLGIVNNETYHKIEEFLKNVVIKKSHKFNNAHLVDGLGSKRAAIEILKLGR